MKAPDPLSGDLRLLLEVIFVRYGYDFRNYAPASLERRIRNRQAQWGLKKISEMQQRILADSRSFDTLLLDLSINVTEMFRDPAFFKCLRHLVVPALLALPLIKVWHAGCATGEEVYSVAILMREAGAYDRTRLFATDFNQIVLRRAKEGVFPIDRLRTYTANYQKSGGRESFAAYYDAHYESAIMSRGLKKNMVFACHNLATDGLFGDMNLIICRNVLIYFNRELQNRVLRLFRDSLPRGGFLCLGSKESLRFSDCADDFEEFESRHKVYRKR